MIGTTAIAILFLMMVFVPGFLNAWASGTLEERSDQLAQAFYRGLLIFWASGIINGTMSYLSGKSFTSFFSWFLTVSTKNNESGLKEFLSNVQMSYLYMPYILAIVLGLLELWSNVRGDFLFSFRCKAWNKIWRMCKKPENSLEVVPWSVVKRIMWQYRETGTMPYLEITTKEKQIIKGCCVKYGWGTDPGFLLLNLNDPEQTYWVSWTIVSSIRFANLFEMQEKIRTQEAKEKQLKLMELVHPGMYHHLKQRETFKKNRGDMH